MSDRRVVLCDVAPRDGLQADRKVLDPQTRAELVDRLAGAGLPPTDASSTVAPASTAA